MAKMKIELLGGRYYVTYGSQVVAKAETWEQADLERSRAMARERIARSEVRAQAAAA